MDLKRSKEIKSPTKIQLIHDEQRNLMQNEKANLHIPVIINQQIW